MELRQQKVSKFRNIDFGIPEGFNRNYDFWFSETPPYLTLTPGQKNRLRMKEYNKRKKLKTI